MKNKVLALSIVTLLAATLFAEDGMFPKMKFKSTYGNVGVVTLDSLRHSTTFEFKNEGNAPLVISSSRVSCSCLTVEFPKDSIAPDSVGEILVTYDASEKTEPENIYKSVYLFTNCEQQRISLTIRGTFTNAHDSVPATTAER